MLFSFCFRVLILFWENSLKKLILIFRNTLGLCIYLVKYLQIILITQHSKHCLNVFPFIQPLFQYQFFFHRTADFIGDYKGSLVCQLQTKNMRNIKYQLAESILEFKGIIHSNFCIIRTILFFFYFANSGFVRICNDGYGISRNLDLAEMYQLFLLLLVPKLVQETTILICVQTYPVFSNGFLVTPNTSFLCLIVKK